MRIVVFDQATIKTGYAIFDNSDLTRWGLINLTDICDTEHRLKYMLKEIANIVVKTKPDIIVFEDINQRNNIKTLITLARLQGEIMAECYTNNIDFAIYPPSTWRRLIGIQQGSHIKRESLKLQAIAFVERSYGITVGDDVAESICIGLAYLTDHEMLSNNKKAKYKNKG